MVTTKSQLTRPAAFRRRLTFRLMSLIMPTLLIGCAGSSISESDHRSSFLSARDPDPITTAGTRPVDDMIRQRHELGQKLYPTREEVREFMDLDGRMVWQEEIGPRKVTRCIPITSTNVIATPHKAGGDGSVALSQEGFGNRGQPIQRWIE